MRAGYRAVFGQILAHQVDYADLYFQYSRSESWSLEEGIVKSGSFNIDQGVGVRAVSGEKTAFAYSDDISLPALQSAAEATRAIARQGGEGRTQVARRNEGRALYLPQDPLASLDDAGQGSTAGEDRALCARPRPARHAGDRQPGGGIRSGAGGALRRRDWLPMCARWCGCRCRSSRRRTAAASKALRVAAAASTTLISPMRCLRDYARQGRGSGAGQSQRASRARRHHDRGAGPGLAGRPAARGDRPWAGGRFQPQGQLGVHAAGSASVSPRPA